MGEQRIKVDSIDKLRVLYVAITRARDLVLLPSHLLDFDYGDEDAEQPRLSA
jgi:ATP-dependent exoDNAse (exonuclease V) beta subunit